MASAREKRRSPSGTSLPETISWRSGWNVISRSAWKSRWKDSTGNSPSAPTLSRPGQRSVSPRNRRARRCSAAMNRSAQRRSPRNCWRADTRSGVKADGYKVWQDTLAVVAGEAQSITGIKLEPADAALFLASQPARANATVDGNYLGLTPLEVPLAPGQATEIRLFKQGYKPAARSVTAQSGEQKRLSRYPGTRTGRRQGEGRT